jgi:hypothetical protein
MFWLLIFIEIRRKAETIKPSGPCMCKQGYLKLHETTSKSSSRDESGEFHGSSSGGLVQSNGWLQNCG